MKITLLEPDEELTFNRRSIGVQHRNKLSVFRGGQWAPIVYDVLDYIDCGRPVSHKAIVTDDVEDDGFTQTGDYITILSSPGVEAGAPITAAFLEPHEENELSRISRANQYRDGVSILKGGEWTPIQFDVFDYANCDGIKTHKAILTTFDENPDNKDYFVRADNAISGDNKGLDGVLLSSDKNDVTYRSSIGQHSNKLSVIQKGEWVPLSYDVLDYINCDGVKSHKAVVTDGDDIGYTFEVEEQHYYIDKYIYADREKLELRELPHWFGEGFYDAYVKDNPFINADNGSLGSRTGITRRVGIAYALAAETLEADD